MQVSCGAEWNTSGGNKRSYSIALDDTDLREIKGDDFVDTLSRTQKLKELNKAADLLVIAYLAQEGAITQEFAEQRIREIKCS